MLKLFSSLNSISGRVSRGSGLGQRAFFRSGLVRKADGVRNSWDVDQWLAKQQSKNVPVFPMLRPLVPGASTYINGPISDALLETLKRRVPFVCAVLLKDAPGTEEDMYKLKGKELFDRIHKVGTLSNVIFPGGYLNLSGYRRVRITEMVSHDVVSEDLLRVNVNCLKDLPYNEDDAVIKEISHAVRSAYRDLMEARFRRCNIPTDMQAYGLQQCMRCNIKEWAYEGAVYLRASKLEAQAILEELDVHKRLLLTFELVKKAAERDKIQEEQIAEAGSGHNCNVEESLV